MKLNLKTIGLALAALLGALVLAVALFFVFFPKQAAAREAERRIEAATGRTLSLGDDISVSFWPALGFSVGDVSLSNPEGFSSDQAFIAAERIVFAVDAWALLRGAIEVKQLIFENAQLLLEAKSDGAANWAFPTEQSAPTAANHNRRFAARRCAPGRQLNFVPRRERRAARTRARGCEPCA